MKDNAAAACNFHSTIGILGISASDTSLRSLSFGAISLGALRSENAIIERAIAEITEYLDGKRKVFDVPVEVYGTAFQMKVWEALKKIPYGKTCSYKEIARAIGNEKAVRAAGSAIGKNPIAIIIPCHRVIGADGSLTGFAGGLAIKQRLLEIEK